MRHKKVSLITVILLCLGLTIVRAQETIPASGGNASGTGGTASYSVGQIVYSTSSTTSGSLAQGVQQPFEISVATAIDEARDISLEFVIYPNPAADFVTLRIENYEIVNLRYQFYNINGNLLKSNKIEGQVTNISMETLTPSTYFLKITDRNKVIKTFKIIKN